jgi:small subunit ribosomal protein S7
MPRKGPAPKRHLNPDPIYRSLLVTQIVNKILQRGKRTLAERIVYQALDIIKEKTGNPDPIPTLKRAIENVKPALAVKSRRVGGATHQVPVEVRQDRRVALGMRWIISYAKARGEKTMKEKLAGEIMDAANNRGNAVKKREDTHKMAEANKAFAHYRW